MKRWTAAFTFVALSGVVLLTVACGGGGQSGEPASETDSGIESVTLDVEGMT